MSMTKIATVTVGAGGASSIDFTSIPGTFTDLMVQVSTRDNRSGATANAILISFNGSTTSFSSRYLEGTGSGVGSGTGTRDNLQSASSTSTANTFSTCQLYIPNYAGSTNKSYSTESIFEQNATTAYIDLWAGLWSNTAAITQVTLTPNASASFVQYSTATLYGITKGSLAGVTVS